MNINQAAGDQSSPTAISNCAACGYDLRGHAIGTPCPECGTVAGKTPYGVILRLADPRWLHITSLGMAWLVFSWLLIFLNSMGTWRLWAQWEVADRSGSYYPLSVAIEMFIGWSLLGGIHLASLFMFTAREPRGPSGNNRYRQIVRAGMGGAFAINILVISVTVIISIASADQFISGEAIYAMPASFKDSAGASLLPLLALLGLFAGVVGFAGLTEYVRRLAVRTPAPKLAWQMNIARLVLGISLVLYLLTLGLAAMGVAIPLVSAATVIVSSIGLIVGFIWWVVATVLLYLDLRHAMLSAYALRAASRRPKAPQAG